MSNRTIVVFGATGQQGEGLVNALLEHGTYNVRGITRSVNSEKAKALSARGVEMVAADLNAPESLEAAVTGAYGVFLVTNFWDPDASVSETELVKGAVKAAKTAGIQHFVWSTLPNTREISGGKYQVVHFTNKAMANAIVSEAGFKYHSFVEAPSYFQNLIGGMGPQPTGNGDEKAWTLPIDPNKKCLHAGDISDLGKLVFQVFENPDRAGQGQILSLSADTYSWQDLADILNAQGHNIVVNTVPAEAFETFFPGAREISEMMQYFAEYTYFGPDAEQHRAAANALIGDQVTGFADWAKSNMPA